MASPLQEHVSETLTSLKFATKVSFFSSMRLLNTHNDRFIIHILEPRKNLRKSGIEIASRSWTHGVWRRWFIICGVHWEVSTIPTWLLIGKLVK
jgi:hypothetical protein